MKKRNIKIFSALLLGFAAFGFLASPAAAASMFSQMETGVKSMINNAYGGPGGSVTVGQNTFLDSLIFIINTLLSFVGIVFFLLLAYSGYLWMTARGNEEQVKKSKEMMKEIIIALIIIITARIVTDFILTQLSAIIQANT